MFAQAFNANRFERLEHLHDQHEKGQRRNGLDDAHDGENRLRCAWSFGGPNTQRHGHQDRRRHGLKDHTQVLERRLPQPSARSARRQWDVDLE